MGAGCNATLSATHNCMCCWPTCNAAVLLSAGSNPCSTATRHHACNWPSQTTNGAPIYAAAPKHHAGSCLLSASRTNGSHTPTVYQEVGRWCQAGSSRGLSSEWHLTHGVYGCIHKPLELIFASSVNLIIVSGSASCSHTVPTTQVHCVQTADHPPDGCSLTYFFSMLPISGLSLLEHTTCNNQILSVFTNPHGVIVDITHKFNCWVGETAAGASWQRAWANSDSSCRT